MNSANMDAKNIPTRITPTYAAKNFIPMAATTRMRADVIIMPASKNCNRSEILPFTYKRMILNKVLEIQNMDPKILAPSGVAIF